MHSNRRIKGFQKPRSGFQSDGSYVPHVRPEKSKNRKPADRPEGSGQSFFMFMAEEFNSFIGLLIIIAALLFLCNLIF